MDKTKIIIVRHTQTTGNVEKRLTGRTDYPITELGKDYINKLTERLKNIKFDKIYASTSGRTVKTVEKLANINKLTIEQDENLCEMYFGIYDGWKWKEVDKVNPEIHENHIKTNEIMGIPEQETIEQVQIRMTNEITKLAQENKGKTILICSHGVAIEAFLRWITKEPFICNKEKYSQHNTSVNIVDYNSENHKYEIEVLNDITHLM